MSELVDKLIVSIVLFVTLVPLPIISMYYLLGLNKNYTHKKGLKRR
jgi:hypothetical protein